MSSNCRTAGLHSLGPRRAWRVVLVVLFCVVGVWSRARTALSCEFISYPHRDCEFVPGFGDFVRDNPGLGQAGSVWIENDAGDWILLACGEGPPLASDDGYLSAPFLAADMNALELLAENAGDSGFAGDEWFHAAFEQVLEHYSRLGIKTEGVVFASRIVGRWRDDAWGLPRVLRAVCSPGHPLGRLRHAFSAADIRLNTEWRAEFLARPGLKRGGLEIVERDGLRYALVTGACDIRAAAPSRLAAVRARNNYLAYFKGIHVLSQTEAYSSAIFSVGVGAWEWIYEKARTVVSGYAPVMRDVGGWRLPGEELLVRAFVQPLE